MAIIQDVYRMYVGDGVTTEFPIVFSLMRYADVLVEVEGSPEPFTFSQGSNFVRLAVAPADGAEVVVYRNTDARNLVHAFQAGSPLVPRYLDENFRQVLYVAQEVVTTSEKTLVTVDAALQTAQDALDVTTGYEVGIQQAVDAAIDATDAANAAMVAVNTVVDTANQAAVDAGNALSTALGIADTADTALNIATAAEADASVALSTALGIADTAAAAEFKADAAVSSVSELRIQGAASWTAEDAPYPIKAQVYHNGKQWLALRANSVEPVEGDDWSELVSQKVVTDALADFDIRTGPYGLRWNQETDIYKELGATVRTQIQSKMRRCVLNSDGTVNYYLDPFDSTKKEDGSPAILGGTDGNVMVEIPKFYYKHSLNGNVHEWWIGEEAVDGMQVHPYFLKDGVTEVDFAYYRAYEGSMQAGVLKSISGVTPTRSITRAAFRTAARLNGPGWNIAHLHGINAVRLLYLLEYNSFDSQSKLGAGNHTGSDHGMLTGQSNVIGNDSSGPLNNNTWMSYRGVENFYADIWEFIDGFNVNNRVPVVSNVEADFADAVYSGSYIEGTVMPSASTSWIQKITGDFLPTQVGGSSATYVTDACWATTGERLCLHGGAADHGLSAGAFALSADNAFSYVLANVGAGLSFR